MDDDPLETAWRALLESHWDDEAKHKAFVSLAATLSRLPDAGAHYKAMIEDPARRERAEAGRQLVVSYALAMLEVLPRSTMNASRARARWFVPLVTLCAMLAADVVLAAVTRQRQFVSIPAFVLEILVVLLLPWRRLLS